MCTRIRIARRLPPVGVRVVSRRLIPITASPALLSACVIWSTTAAGSGRFLVQTTTAVAGRLCRRHWHDTTTRGTEKVRAATCPDHVQGGGCVLARGDAA